MRSIIKVCDREVRVTGNLFRTARLEAEGYHFLDDAVPLLSALRKCATRVDLFTFTQRLPETKPRYDFSMELDNFAVLPVTTFDRWWTEQIGFKARNKAKQAEKKGVVLREVPFNETLVKGIWELYNESPVRQGRPFHHYGKNFETVYKEEATFLDTSIFIGAYLDGTLIGFAKLVHDETKTQAGLMNIVSMIRERDKAPTNALVAQAVRSCADRGISYLVYSRLVYGTKEQSGLVEFKERNGFQRVDIPRYYVPISPVGSIALQFGFQRRLVDRLPANVAAKLRELRSAWHERKYRSMKEAL